MPSHLKGTNGNDPSLKGSNQADTISGLNGDDRIRGNKGNDIIYGGKGNDVLYGGEGNDTIYGGAGDDIINGGYGQDYLYGGEGNSTFIQNAAAWGADLIEGGHGNNSVSYAFTHDVLNFFAPVTVDYIGISGLARTAHVNGIVANIGQHFVKKIAASPAFSLAPYANTTDEIHNIDNIIGTEGSDLIIGSDGDNILDGGGGTGFNKKGDVFDVILAGAGNDTLKTRNASGYYSGGSGNDTIIADDYKGHARILDGGDGVDTINYNLFNVGVWVTLGVDPVTGRGTTTKLSGTSLLDSLYNVEVVVGSKYSDKLYGATASNNTLYGDNGNDLLVGGDADDVLDGGEGADTLIGGGGNNLLQGGEGDDLYKRSQNDGGHTIIDDIAGNDTLDLSDFKRNEIKISRAGLDLRLDFLTGKMGDLTVLNWGSSAGAQIERIIFSNQTLSNVQINAALPVLVQAMATFATTSAAPIQDTSALSLSTPPSIQLLSTSMKPT